MDRRGGGGDREDTLVCVEHKKRRYARDMVQAEGHPVGVFKCNPRVPCRTGPNQRSGGGGLGLFRLLEVLLTVVASIILECLDMFFMNHLARLYIIFILDYLLLLIFSLTCIQFLSSSQNSVVACSGNCNRVKNVGKLW